MEWFITVKFQDIYKELAPAVSFELFPPRTPKGMRELEERLPKLVSLNPAFITVTYGALGSTRGRTLEIVSLLKNGFGMETSHHLTCVGSNKEEITGILEDIRGEGIENIVALRGDPPRGTSVFSPTPDGYSHGNELVEHIRDFGDFGIGVAGYPETHIEATDPESDLENLKRKVESGADVIITQLFYDNDHFYRFLEKCRAKGIRQPIIPGLMPILGFEQIKRITGICGASIPATLLYRLEQAGEDIDEIHRIGIQHTADQAQDLLDQGAQGIHFYVLNQHFHIAEIMERIKPMIQ